MAGQVAASSVATSTCSQNTAALVILWTTSGLRFVTRLSGAADLAGLPADPEFRAAIMGYADGRTRLAVGNSAPDAALAPHAPVPRWDGASRRRISLSGLEMDETR